MTGQTQTELPGTLRSDAKVTLAAKIAVAGSVSFLLYFAVQGGLFHFDDKPQLGALLSFAFFLHLWTRPRFTEVLLTVLLAAAFRVLYGQPHPVGGSFFALFTYGALLGLASIIVLGVQVARSRGDERERKRAVLTASLLAPVAFMLLGFPLRLTIALHPKTYDHILYAFDGSLGFQPSFLIGKAFRASAALRIAASVAYDVVLPVIACFYVAQIVGKKRFQVDVVKVFIGTLFFGTMLYHVCPAAGPVYAFGKAFPGNEPAVTQLPMAPVKIPQGPRNAMPSLHFACALLVWWNSRVCSRWCRALALLFLVLTALATLGLGEHYLIDLVVAVPFTVAMTAATATSIPSEAAERRRALFGGGVLTGVWLVLLRSGFNWMHASPALSWFLVATTLAISLELHRRLAHAASLPVRRVLQPRAEPVSAEA